MKSYIIGIVSILILLGLFYFNKPTEHFSNLNLIDNGGFANGKDISNAVDLETRENNFTIIEMANPENLTHVLKQSRFVKGVGYKISLNLPKNTNYSLTYWLGSNADYDGPDNTMMMKGNVGLFTENTKKINSQTIDGIFWRQIQTRFNSKNNTEINLDIGSQGQFTKGFRCYSDFILTANLENVSDFHVLDKLVAFFIASNTIDGDTVKSEVNNHLVRFKNPIIITDNLITLKENEGMLPNADIVLVNDKFENEFSVMFSYKGIEYDSGTFLNFDAVNDISSGIRVDFRYTNGINNRIIVTVAGISNTYNIGLAVDILVNCVITYSKSKGTRLYIDGVEIDMTSQENSIPEKELGTCPDGWQLEDKDTGKCIRGNSINKSNSGCGNMVEDKQNDIDKKAWAETCGVSWTNCQVLSNMGDRNNGRKSGCGNNVKLHFANTPVMLNRDSGLQGSLKCLLIYNKELSKKEAVSVIDYFRAKNAGAKFSVDAVANRPSTFRDSLDGTVVSNESYSNQVEDDDCPFLDKSVCRNAPCSCVNWTTLANVPDQCKNIVNSYCKDNYTDSKCVSLRKRKCAVDVEKNPIIKRDNDIEKLKLEIDLLKKRQDMQKNKKDCTDCDSKIDLSKYIKKSDIPCWGCKL